MKKELLIIFILLSIHMILGDPCKEYEYYSNDEEYTSECIECNSGYFLYRGKCFKNYCVEGENEDSCLKCSIETGRCLSCYSEDYSVYNEFQCKKSYLTCGNNTIQHCKSCDNNSTGNCAECYNEYKLENNECHFNGFISKAKGEINRQNIFLLSLFVIFLFLVN